jgi:adenylate cyclase
LAGVGRTLLEIVGRARLALVVFLKGDLEGAIQEADHALAINPNCADAFGAKGASLIFSGHREEGRKVLGRYFALSPLDPMRPLRLNQVALSLYLDGNYDAAVTAAAQLIRQYPTHPSAYRWLAASLGQLGRLDEANRALHTMIEMAPLSVEMFIRQRPAFYRPADHKHLLEGLRKAGLPER